MIDDPLRNLIVIAAERVHKHELAWSEFPEILRIIACREPKNYEEEPAAILRYIAYEIENYIKSCKSI